MNNRRRFKLSAGVGLATMLIGALMVVAPSAGAVDLGAVPDDAVLLPVGGGRVPICHSTGSHENPYVRNTPSFSATGGPSANHDSHDGPVYGGLDTEEWGDIIPPVAVGGHLVYAGSDNWDEGGAELYAACSAGAQEAPRIVIEKDVPGEGSDPTEFQFGVAQGGTPVAFQGPGDNKITETESLQAVVAAGQVVVTETPSARYTLSGVTCAVAGAPEDEQLATTVDLDRGTATFGALAGDVITCTFTNDADTGGQTGSIRIDKVVAGTAANAQPADRKFGFSAVCKDAAQAPLVLDITDATFELTNTGDPNVIGGLPGGATCTIEETVRHSPNGGTTVKVGTGTAASAFKAENVAVVADQITDIVFTNIYNTETIIIETPTTTTTAPPEPASLTLSKVVETVDGSEGPATWQVQFDVLGDDFDQSRVLDQDATSDSFGDLDAGTYSITERLGVDDTSTLTDVECVELNGGDVDVVENLADDRATVVLDEGDDVVCTFTNTYPAVLPTDNEPEPEPEPEPTVEEPKATAAVLGVQTVRALPRTGGETKGLAGAGVLLVALGAALVIGSKRQLAQR